ncbi:dihydrofolate reductase [Fibrobacterales bacterium]|nr:dihydrofolate reductase [Fibrobacterales bacterium]
MQISIIVAISENGVIGKDNSLPWRMPADLQYFKKTTLGHPIIMGRKNYESILRPLPERTNIILTRNPNFTAFGCEIAANLQDAFNIAEKTGSDECFVIGGAEIYEEALPFCQKLYVTVIHKDFEGDVYFPAYNSLPAFAEPATHKISQFIENSRVVFGENLNFRKISEIKNFADAKNIYDYDFTIWERE